MSFAPPRSAQKATSHLKSSQLPNSQPAGSQQALSSSQQAEMSFPLIKAAEIIQCLHELNIVVNDEDLAKPTSGVVMYIWRELLDLFSGINVERFDKPKGGLLGMLNYPELISNPLSNQMLFFHVRRLAMQAGIRSFTYADLVRPETGTLKKHLSAVINFAKFREEHMRVYQDLVTSGEDARVHRDQVVWAIEEHKRAIAQINEQRAADEPRIDSAQQRNEELKTLLKDYTRIGKEDSDTYNKLKGESANLKQRVGNIHLEHEQAARDVLNHKQRIIQSPERVKRVIGNLAVEANMMKEATQKATREAGELQKKLDVISSLEKDLQVLILENNSIQDALSRSAASAQRSSKLKNDLGSKHIDRRAGEAKVEQLSKQLENSKASMQRLHDQHSEKIQRVKLKIEEKRDECSQLQDQRRARQHEVDAFNRAAREIEDEMRIYTDETQMEFNALMTEYAELRRKTDEYMNELTGRLGLNQLMSEDV